MDLEELDEVEDNELELLDFERDQQEIVPRGEKRRGGKLTQAEKRLKLENDI